MIIKKMHWLVKSKFNKLNSNHYGDLTPMQIDEAINDGIRTLIKEFTKSGEHEKTQQKLEMFSTLLVKYPDQPFIKLLKVGDVDNFEIYKANKSDLKFDYFHLSRVYSQTKCGMIDVNIVLSNQHLTKDLKDEFSQPSKKWKRALGSYNNNSFLFYFEKGINPDKVVFEYYKRPVNVFYGGYDTLEYDFCKKNNGGDCSEFYSKSTKPVDCDLNEDYHDIVVEYAVKELSRNLEDVNKLQLQQEKINKTV